MSESCSALAHAASFVLRALDPCAPLGVLECARWALSARAQDGLCVVLVAAYSVYTAACVLRKLLRAPPSQPVAVSPERFWPGRPDPRTRYVRRGLTQKTQR